ncbi:alpha/beta fold hydrolase [Streptomyces sp. NBC_01022]|uniref:alpha/beta fold hydrolase n=1 Tax=Streptomyces sp. NBC_01022 TaxID=2903723 RepID=UPI002DD809BA|nr:alpha/beta fold hydrolase [Streptomyces sp. NBC_01022]WRZ82300.1 alpha/beta hydrolase [Streptomyces sp. NBC_01022]
MSGRFTAADGTLLVYDDLGPAGELPPVVLVHGHPFNRSMWQPQTAALVTAGYRVIVPDLRGYGDSGVVPGGTGRTLLADFADDIAALLDHLGLARAVVGGVSMGGQIAMEFHRAYPGRVAALVLADTSPVAETEDGKAFRNRLADRLLAEGMGGYADEVIDKMLAPYNVTGLPDVAARVLGMMRTTAPEGAAAALRGRAERADYRESLAGSGVPVLVVVGADDVYTPVAEARVLHGLIPGAELVVVEGAGHLPGLERPEVFNGAMVRFLTGVGSASGPGSA